MSLCYRILPVREAEVLASLSHPNIAGIHGIEHEGDTHAIAMELVEGETLAALISRGPIPLDETLEIARQIAEALEAAHEKGIIHRDLKPANVKITPESKVKVLDFGLAKALVPESTASDLSNSPTMTVAATQMGVILGTAAYMAPEQARGKPVDKRADIWAFGAVLYEMLTGRRAFGGSNLSDVLASVIKTDPDWATLPGDTLPRIRQLLRACLQKDLKQRVRDIGDVLLVLDGAFETRNPAPATTVRPLSFWRQLLPLAAVGMAVATLTAVVVWNIRSPSGPGDLQPSLRLTIALPEGQEVVVPDLGPALAISRDGSVLVYTGPSDTGPWQLWARRRDDLSATPLPGTDGAMAPILSPNGTEVAFHSGQPSPLRVVSLAGGQPRTLVDTVSAARGDWGVDGMVYYQAADYGISRVPAEGGAPQVVSSPDATTGVLGHGSIHVLPGTESAVITLGTREFVGGWGAIAGLRFGTAALNEVTRGLVSRYAPTGHLVWVAEDASVFAAPFDVDRLELTGDPVRVLDGLSVGLYAAAHLALSETGTLVYAAGTLMSEELVSVDRDGTSRPIDKSWRADFYDMTLAPDGARVASSTSSRPFGMDIWVKVLPGGEPQKLTLEGAINARPFFTPNGESVVFASSRDSPLAAEGAEFLLEGMDLWVKPADGSGPATLLLGGIDAFERGFYAPDEATLVYQTRRCESCQGDIFSIRPGVDDEATPLAASAEFDETHASVSPDGRWLAYTSDENEQLEVYVQPFPDAGGTRWLVSPDGGMKPVWALDSRELYYINANGFLVAAEVVPGALSAGSRTELFPLADYDVVGLAEGTYAVDREGRFLMARRVGDFGNLIWVENWFQELVELVDSGGR